MYTGDRNVFNLLCSVQFALVCSYLPEPKPEPEPPSQVRNIVWHPPALTCATVYPAMTCTGVVLLEVVPSPS